MTTTSPTPLIEDLFHKGHPLNHVVEVGTDEGWTREDVLAVLRDQQWDLDASGRLPRSKRITSPMGLRHMTPAPPPRDVPSVTTATRFEEPLDDVDVAELDDAPAAAIGGLAEQPRVVAPITSEQAAAEIARVQAAHASDGDEPAKAVAGSAYITALQARELGVDHSYQRPLDEPRVKRMAASWDPRMVGTIDVADRGEGEAPRYAVINGQHRAAAAARHSSAGADVWLPCTVHEGLTVAEEAALMHELDRTTKKLSGWDKWRARRGAGDVAVLTVDRIAARHGLRVDDAIADGAMRSYGTAEKLLQLGGEQLLDNALAVLKAAYGDAAAAYQAPLLMGVGQLLHRYPDLDVERLRAALAKARPEQLRASATALRDFEDGPLHQLMAMAIATAYNRAPGSGPKISGGR